MANLQFDQLFDVAPPSTEPVRAIEYERGVDCRSVTFESGVTVLLSDHMSGIFQVFLATPPDDRTGPDWLTSAWQAVLDVIDSQALGQVQYTTVVSYLLGRADYLILYRTFIS